MARIDSCRQLPFHLARAAAVLLVLATAAPALAQFDRGTLSGTVKDEQGAVERSARVVALIDRADAEGFGSCSNEGECEAVCPKEIPISNIARMTREYVKALLTAGK